MRTPFLLLAAISSALLAQDTGPALSVDRLANRRPISPLIYGINDYADDGLTTDLRLGVRRFGGNQTTRFNWRLNYYNAAADWYFGNFPMSSTPESALPDGNKANQVIEAARRQGMVSLVTVPMIGWAPRNRDRICSFSVAKYGPQFKADPYNSDCGNGRSPDDKRDLVNDPNDASMPVDINFHREWLEYTVKRYGAASRGGVSIWALDNEPTIWLWTHRDVHPQQPGYDEIFTKGRSYAAMIKSVDPTAAVAGPVVHGWMAYDYSAIDWFRGWSTGPSYKYWSNPIDRKAHGDVPFLQWYLQQMRREEETGGIRLLDYLTLHGYLLPDGFSFGSAGDAERQAKRLRSTRVLWDPTYKELAAEDTGEAYRLIPRMREWVDRNYPGTKLAITEYNWGALDHINGALAQADVLGIFGREGLDLATLWGVPKAQQPAAFAFRLFRNYDGKGGAFGETSIAAASANQDTLSIYAAERSDSALTLMVINKSSTSQTTDLRLAGFTPAGPVEVWRYSEANLNAIVRERDLTAASAGLRTEFPAASITLMILPASPGQLAPRPEIAGIAHAASYATAIAPGTIVTLFGKDMGPAELRGGEVTAAGFVAYAASGTRVLFNGIPAPVLYTSATQVSAVVPYAVANRPTAHVQVEHQGSRSATFDVPVRSLSPGIFTADASGKGLAAALNQDGSPHSATNPAARGSVVVLFASGEGESAIPGVDGLLAQAIYPKPKAKVTVLIGGVEIDPEYAGAAPNAVAGALQVNVKVPASLPPGTSVPVQLRIGTELSQPGVSLAIR